MSAQASSVAGLRQALADPVEDDLAFCQERGEEPERPCSGQSVVRAGPALHRAIASAAGRAGVSLDRWVTAALERAAAS